MGTTSKPVVQDTTIYARFRNSRIGFNSFLFTNTAQGRYSSPRWSLRAEVGQNSLYNKRLTGGSGRFVQQDYYIKAEQLYAWRPRVSAGFRAQTAAFRAIGNSFGRAEALLRWQLASNRLTLYSEGSSGVATDQRGSIRNTGPSYRLFSQGTTQSRDSTTQYFWQGQITQAFIAPRQMAMWAGKAGLIQKLGSYAQTHVGLGYLRRRVEDYLGNQIQKIESDSIEASLFVGSQLGKRVDFQSDNRILLPSRKFIYKGYDTAETTLQNTRFRQTEVNSRQQISVRGQRIQHVFSIEYSQRNRVYNLDNNLNLTSQAINRALASEKIKDISEATISYAYQGSWQVSKRSSLRGTYTGSLLRVNTTSVQNDQDRDEAFYTGDLVWSHRWLKTLRSSMRLSGSLRNVLFIESTQSAQNYVERVLRLEPTVGYALGRMRLTATFGLWATYNVRQFAIEEAKNRANRVWIQTYQARYQATSRWYILADALRRENRIAQLNWAKFTESPIDTIVLTDLHLRGGHTFLRPHSANTISIESGYKLFRQDRHNVAGVSVPGFPTRQASLHSITLQHGPSMALAWELPGRGRILLDGWLQWTQTRYKCRLSDQVFVGQTYTAAKLNAQERHLYVFFNLTGQLLIH